MVRNNIISQEKAGFVTYSTYKSSIGSTTKSCIVRKEIEYNAAIQMRP